MKYTIEVNDYTSLMVLALIAEIMKSDDELTIEGSVDDSFLKLHLPQVMNWVLFQFDVNVALLVDSDNFDMDNKLWPLVMKSADDLADQIRAHLEQEDKP